MVKSRSVGHVALVESSKSETVVRLVKSPFAASGRNLGARAAIFVNTLLGDTEPHTAATQPSSSPSRLTLHKSATKFPIFYYRIQDTLRVSRGRGYLKYL
jgi:hypothetical protein